MNVLIPITGGILAIVLFGIVVQFQETRPLAKRNIVIYSYCTVTILSSFILAEHSAYIIFVSLFLIIRNIVFVIKGKISKATFLIFLALLLGNIVLPILLI